MVQSARKGAEYMKKIIIALVFTILIALPSFAAGKSQLFEKQGLKIKKCYDSIDRCVVRDRFYLGLADKQGNLIVPCEFFDIRYIEGSKASFSVSKGSDLGIIDKDGHFLTQLTEGWHLGFQVHDNYYKIQNRLSSGMDNYGLIDVNSGKILIPMEYGSIFFDKVGNYSVLKNGFEGVISKDFNVIISPKYHFIMLLAGNKYYRLHLEEKFKNSEGLSNTRDLFGISDVNGKSVVPTDCTWVSKGVSTYNIEVTRNGKNYIFNSSNGSLKEKL